MMGGLGSWFEFVSERRSEVIDLTGEHARLVIEVMLAATLCSIALGIAVRHRPVWKAIALGASGIVLTIPSLALFSIFIPLVGIGTWPPRIALFLYAILPILRNTVTGLDEVDPAIVESARGMGLSGRQRLLKVELPLAWPVIMTGIRISTLLVTGIAAIATLVGGGGLGDFIKAGLTRLGFGGALESVWTGTVFVILLALALDLVLSAIQRLTTSRGLRA